MRLRLAHTFPIEAALSKPALFRFLHGTMALLFLCGAIVQYNDPDPLGWIAIYLAASCACGMAATNRLRRPWLPLVVGITALIWAAMLVPRALPNVGILEMFGAWEMANARIEEGRELYGLILIAAYMGVLLVSATRRGA